MARVPATYVVGSKNFSEQFILAELICDRLEPSAPRSSARTGSGRRDLPRARQRRVDVYVDYSGTLWAKCGRRDTPSREDMLRELTR